MRITIWTGVTLLAGGVAHGASFDCSKATTAVEKMVCASPSLSELDEHLGRYYSGARASVGSAAASCLAKNQREWLLGRRNACKHEQCLSLVYRARLAQLDPLQPGMTAVKNVPLPDVSALVWVQGPAEDTEAAPRTPTRETLRIIGKIVDDVTDGDGFVIQEPTGEKHVLLASMFITKSSGVAYETLANAPDATYEVFGQAETSSDGGTHFAPGHCTFVWRLPKKRTE